jgi:hypothetical protein
MPPDFYNWKKRIATMIESTPALKAKIPAVGGWPVLSRSEGRGL